MWVCLAEVLRSNNVRKRRNAVVFFNVFKNFIKYMFFRKVFSPFFRANFCFYKLHKNGKKAVECRLIKSVFSLAIGQSNPPLFRNFQSSWLSWCTFEGPFRYQLKHVKEKSPGSAESNDANSKWVSSGSWKQPRRGAEFRKVFEYIEAQNAWDGE